MVRLHTTQGPVDLRLFDTEAPKTVSNFLGYVHAGAYTDVFFHRSARLGDGRPFVIQSGGFKWSSGSSVCCTGVTSRGKLINEFSSSRSNVRGAVAMAKVGGDPNSATSQWFINLSDNSTNLDNQNGGFTVFARVTAPSMAIADKIAALPVVNAGGNYSELPVDGWTTGNQVMRGNLVLIPRVTEFPPLAAQSASDRIFNFLEASYPQYVPVEGVESGTALGYLYRYYPKTNSYLGTKDGKVWYLVPAIGSQIQELADLTYMLAAAEAAGY
jgi:cyclophilin family peptidyl-prolyl cis-trans isomerase